MVARRTTRLLTTDHGRADHAVEHGATSSPRRVRPLANTEQGARRRGRQGLNPMRGFGGDGGKVGGSMISITRCRMVTMAASCTSSRCFSSFSNTASCFASSRLSPNNARILRNARTTRSTPLRAGSHAHLNSPPTVQNIGRHHGTMFSERVRSTATTASMSRT